MNAWYNEIEPYAAQWIENLAAAGHVASGTVERRSIVDLGAGDVPVGRQCHFFAGVGVWSAALRLAGWPDDVPVWTGSCPCQPFSDAGRKRGFDDERHLWPAWFKLIGEHRPSVVFGEQVASPPGLAWFDAVSSDLENAGYTVGAADLCAAGVGAPHIRQRLFFVAVAEEVRRGSRWRRGSLQGSKEHERPALESRGCGDARRGGLGDSAIDEPSQHRPGEVHREEAAGASGVDRGDGTTGTGETRGFWSPADWLRCRDGKVRPVEPGTFPLVDGNPTRVARVRAYGNAISPQVAGAFVEAAIDWLSVT